MMHRIAGRPALLLALVFPLAACEQFATAPARGGETTVVLNQSGAASGALLPTYSAAVAEMAGPVALSDVRSIEVTVTEVQALPRGADSTRTEGWVSFEVTAPVKVNLLALPTAAGSGIQLARGEIQPGTYNVLRVVFSEASITFAKNVTAGGGPAAKTYTAGTAYPLAVGGGERTGVLVPIGAFTVGEASATSLEVTFDGAASVRKVIATPAGVRITPVLSARNKGKG